MPGWIYENGLKWGKNSTSMKRLKALLVAGKPEDECWPWEGKRDRDGYGQTNINDHPWKTHRAAWALTVGPIPPGLCVLHRCDNPPCVNPGHLFLGTNVENIADRDAKGRAASGDRSGARLHPESRLWGDRNPSRSKPWTRPRGAANGMATHPESRMFGSKCHLARLVETDIPLVRGAKASGISTKQLMAAYGVSESTIDNAAARRTWRHVP